MYLQSSFHYVLRKTYTFSEAFVFQSLRLSELIYNHIFAEFLSAELNIVAGFGSSGSLLVFLCEDMIKRKENNSRVVAVDKRQLAGPHRGQRHLPAICL